MPYLKHDEREALKITVPRMEDVGELNYVLTQVIKAYVGQSALRYWVINDVMGALECAKLEFFRRVAIPYENIKRKENGDVYDDY
jgi:hypothetical protein